MMLRRIRVVGASSTRNLRVKFSEHEKEHPKFVPRSRQVHQHNLSQKVSTNLDVTPVIGHIQHNPKLFSQVVQTLGTSVQTPGLLATQQQLHTVSQKSVVVLALDKAFEDLLVTRIDESLEDEHKRNHVLDLAPGKTERSTAVRQVVNSVGTRSLVRSDTSNLTAVGSVGSTTLGERRSVKVDRVVSSGNNEVSDDLLVTVDDKVTTERGRFFAVLDEFSGRKALKVTSY